MRLRNIPGARDMIAASPWVVHKPEEYCGKWKSFFGNDHPLHLEIGTGKGRFIMQLAQEHPEINYIGIEKYSSVLLRCLEKQQELELKNLIFIRGDAELINTYFAEGEIDKSISIFPIRGRKNGTPEGAFLLPNICAAMT